MGCGLCGLGTNNWTRMSPTDDDTYSSRLGDYHVEWTNEHGRPGFASVKFETLFDGFGKNKSDTFRMYVTDFDSDTSMQVQVHAGLQRERFSFDLTENTCLPHPYPEPSYMSLRLELRGELTPTIKIISHQSAQTETFYIKPVIKSVTMPITPLNRISQKHPYQIPKTYNDDLEFMNGWTQLAHEDFESIAFLGDTPNDWGMKLVAL